MSAKYFIFSISRPGAVALFIAFSFFVSSSYGIPVAFPDESLTSSSTSAPTTTTVKILIPPSSDDISEDDDDDAVVIEAGNSTDSPFPREPFHPMDCFAEKEKGPCRAIIDMWFFNQETKTCESFQYSGCGGNGNRFSEKEECESRCGSAKSGDDVDDDSDAVVIDAGTNDDDKSNNGTCPEFDGCGPLKCAVLTDETTGCKKCACNVSPEDEEESSDDAKLPVGSVSGTPSEDDEAKTKKEKPEDVCGLPEVRGDCRAMVTRYRYDSKTKQCVMFHFGGCNSNGNNFVSEEKCMQFCKGQ